MIRVLAVLGTRPEYLKLWPVLHLLQSQADFVLEWVFTGQHRDLIEDFRKDFPFKAPLKELKTDLEKSLNAKTSDWIEQLDTIVGDFDWVFVQGDTASAWTGAVAAFQQKKKIAHLEAGMRSGDLMNPWPEEGYRKMISAIASLHFCPTQKQFDQLLKEGVAPKLIGIVGNTLLGSFEKVFWKNEIDTPKKGVLFTCHRREVSENELEILICELVNWAEKNGEVVFWVTHPKYSKDFIAKFKSEFLKVLAPLHYADLMRLLGQVRCVLTDSGGLQEECKWAGVPSGILRKTNEWENGFPLLGFDWDKISRFLTENSMAPKSAQEKWDGEVLLRKWREYEV